MSVSDAAALKVSERPFVTLIKTLLWVFWGIVLYFMIQIREIEMADDEVTTVFLFIFGLIWIASTLTMAQYALSRAPVLNIDPLGFTDRRTFTKIIPWSEISAAEAKDNILKLTVKQPYRFRWLSGLALMAMPFLKGLFATGNYNLPLGGLDRSPAEIAAAISSLRRS